MRKGFVLPLILIIVAIVLIAVGAIAYLQFKPTSFSLEDLNRNISIKPSSSITSLSSPSPSIRSSEGNKTVNWETYTNSQLGFSLKNPTNWILYTPSNTDIYIRNQDFESKESKAKPRYPNSGYPYDYIYLRVISNMTDNDVKGSGYNKAIDWYQDLVSKKEKANIWTGTFDLSTVKNIVIDKKPSVVVKISFDETTAEVFTPVGNNIHHLIVSPYEKFNDEAVNQILTTFRFD